MGRDPYDILGVGRDADDEEIRRAYHRRAKEEHPDAGGQTDDFFCRLNEAYEAIRTADRRREYDRRRTTGTPFGDAAGEPIRRPPVGTPHPTAAAGLFDLFDRMFTGRGWGSLTGSGNPFARGGPWWPPDRWGAGNRTAAAAFRRARSHRLSIDLSPADAQRGVSFEVALPEGRQRIDLPADLRDGDELTYHEPDAAGGELYLTVDVRLRSPSR